MSPRVATVSYKVKCNKKLLHVCYPSWRVRIHVSVEMLRNAKFEY